MLTKNAVVVIHSKIRYPLLLQKSYYQLKLNNSIVNSCSVAYAYTNAYFFFKCKYPKCYETRVYGNQIIIKQIECSLSQNLIQKAFLLWNNLLRRHLLINFDWPWSLDVTVWLGNFLFSLWLRNDHIIWQWSFWSGFTFFYKMKINELEKLVKEKLIIF